MFAEQNVESTGSFSAVRSLLSLLLLLPQIPLWQVKVSAVAHRGRLSELWPFIGYRKVSDCPIDLIGQSIWLVT